MINLNAADMENLGRTLNEAASAQLTAAELTRDFALVGVLKPKIAKDGNQWCILYGDNLQEGIAGFGDTPAEAAHEFTSAWFKR